MALTPPIYGKSSYMAYCRIWISGTEITMTNNKPQRLLSFDYHQTNNFSANTATLSIYDKDWDFVEQLILASDKKVQFQFGYEGSPPSPKYEGLVFDYTPTFAIDGVKLDIIVIMTGITEDNDSNIPRRSPDGWKGKKIHEIVIDIGTKHGLAKGKVDPTLTVWDNDGIDTSKLIPKQFTQGPLRDYAFIENVLAPLARRDPDKKGDYRFYFKDKDKTFNFHPPYVTNDVVQIFNFMRSRLSEVIAFSPSLMGSLVMGNAGTAGISFMDRQSGKVADVGAYNKNTPEKTVLGGRLTDERLPEKELYHHVAVYPVRDLDQATIISRNRYFSFYNSVYSAELVIHGYPFDGSKYEIQQVVWVNVIKRDGTLHYSSGLYAIYEITHSIANGSFTTTLSLMRNGYPDTGGATGDSAVGEIVGGGGG